MAWTEIQSKAGTDDGVDETSLTFDEVCVSGNLVEVKISCQDPDDSREVTVTVGGVSMDLSVDGRNPDLASGWKAWVFNKVLAAGGAHEVVASFNQSVSFIRISISESSGNAAESVLDQATFDIGNSAVPSSGNMVPSEDGERVSGYAITQSGNIAVGSGFNALDNADNFDESEYLHQGSAATIDADFTADSHQWLALGATYRGVPATPPPQLPYLGLYDVDLNALALMDPDLA